MNNEWQWKLLNKVLSCFWGDTNHTLITWAKYKTPKQCIWFLNWVDLFLEWDLTENYIMCILGVLIWWLSPNLEGTDTWYHRSGPPVPYQVLCSQHCYSSAVSQFGLNTAHFISRHNKLWSYLICSTKYLYTEYRLLYSAVDIRGKSALGKSASVSCEACRLSCLTLLHGR